MKILIVEDDDATRKGIEAFLRAQQYETVSLPNAVDVAHKYQHERFDLIITDMQMPGMTGLELLVQLRELSVPTPVIIITAFASVEDAVQAMKKGAEDYLTKPLNLEELLLKVQKIEQKITLLNENKQLKSRLSRLEFPNMIGESKAMRDIQKFINKVADDPDVTVMIYGESGTGKELVASTIHRRSNRADMPFIAVNCAAFSDELLESELFGHKKGAFTGAYRDKIGLFQAAHKGSFFLDEVSEMSPRMQAKLLRAIQEQTIQPVGSPSMVAVDVRIIGASNKNLQQLVDQGLFREDLFYRLNVVEIHLLPLRERREDIPLLIYHFLDEYNATRQERVLFSREVVDILIDYFWPGNVRELQNLVRRLVITCEGSEVNQRDLPKKIIEHVRVSTDDWEALIQINDYKTAVDHLMRDFEKEFLTYHLKRHHGNISKTADSIGLSRVAIHKKIKEYQLNLESKG